VERQTYTFFQTSTTCFRKKNDVMTKIGLVLTSLFAGSTQAASFSGKAKRPTFGRATGFRVSNYNVLISKLGYFECTVRLSALRLRGFSETIKRLLVRRL
jgi:hypothetical protein